MHFFKIDVTSPPLNVTLSIVDHEQLHVMWTPPPSSEQSGDIINYTVRVTEVDTNRTWEDNANLATLWTLSNLHPYYTYDVQVKAVPTSGTGMYSDTVSARTLPSGKRTNIIVQGHSQGGLGGSNKLLFFVPICNCAETSVVYSHESVVDKALSMSGYCCYSS